MAANWQVGDRIYDNWDVHRVLQGGMGIVYIVSDTSKKWLRDQIGELRAQEGAARNWEASNGVKLSAEDRNRLSAVFDGGLTDAAARLEKQVFLALKTIQPRYARSPEACARFAHESRTWIKLGAHPHIVKAHSVVEIEDLPFLVMEYVAGGSLRSWIGRKELGFEKALALAIQFCDGMLHAQTTLGLIHRDIKPENVLLDHGFTLKITDFGLAKAFDSPTFSEESPAAPVVSPQPLRTRPGARAGTLFYMSPEQLEGRPLDPRSDLYAFGLLLYEMLTARHPLNFPSGDRKEDLVANLLQQQEQQRWPPPSRLVPGVPLEFDAIVARCLALAAGHRYSGFDTLRADLTRIRDRLQHRRSVEASEDSAQVDYVQIDWNAMRKQKEDHLRRLDEHLGVMKIDGISFDEWYIRAKSLLELQDYPTALTAVDKSLTIIERLIGRSDGDGYHGARGLTPREVHVPARELRAFCLVFMKRPDEALKAADDVVALAPGKASSWLLKGQCLLQFGPERAPELLECAERALELDPKLALASRMRGTALGELGRLEEAVQSFARALEVNPHDEVAQRGWLRSLALLDRKHRSGSE